MSEERLVPKLRFSGFNDGWESTKIGEIAEIVGGGTPKTEVEKYWNGEIKWFTPSEIGKIKYILDSERHITEEGLKNSSAKLLPANTILLSSRATVGEVSIALTECSTNQGFQSLITKNNVDNEFVYYLISTIKNEFIRRASGSTFLEISKNEIKRIPITIPTLSEQKKISNLFSAIDNKIELLHKKHQYYHEFKKYLMQQIFAQKLRFKINSSYTNYKLKDIVTKFSTGLNPRKNFKLNEGGENYYVTIKNFQNGILNLDDKCDKIDDNALKLINKRSDLQKDDLIFASIGRVGEVYLIKNNPLNWNINESVFSLRPNKQFIEPKFLYYLLNSNKIQNYFESNITGSTFKSIKMKDLKNTPVTIPDSFELQNEIVKLLSSVDSKIFFIENEFTDIKKFKKGLLQQMFVFLISSILFLIVYLFR